MTSVGQMACVTRGLFALFYIVSVIVRKLSAPTCFLLLSVDGKPSATLDKDKIFHSKTKVC